MKRFLTTFVLTTSLLAGCNDTAPTQPVATEDTTEDIVVEKTAQQYLTEFQQTPLFQQSTTNVEHYFTETVDFEGDAIPEVVVGVATEAVTTAKLLIFQWDNNEWQEVKQVTYDTHMAISLNPLGVLTYDEAAKQAFAFEKLEAAATSMSSTITIVHADVLTSDIETLASISLESNATFEKANNTFTVTTPTNMIHYVFSNGHITDLAGNPIGLIIDEELAALVGTTVNNYLLTYEDNYHVAKEKIQEPLIEEAFGRGAMCANYATFIICDIAPATGLFTIDPAHMVTAADISSFFNEPLKFSEAENILYRGEGSAYVSEVVTDDGIYLFEFDGTSSEAVLHALIFSPFE